MSNISFDGLATGLDTSSLIERLMLVERQPLVRLQQRQTTFNNKVTAWGEVGTALSTLRTKLNDVLTPLKFNLFKATGSDDSIFTATASSSATPGTTTFRVTQLAAAHQLASAGFASDTTLVGAGTMTVGEGLSSLGFTAAVASSGLTEGSHTVKVTAANQPATGAVVSGNPPPNLPVSFSPGNRQINYQLNGASQSVFVPSGTYNTVAELAAAMQSVMAGVTVEDGGGYIKVTTTATGSTASLRFTGGSGLAKTGLAVMGTPNFGSDSVDAIIEVDGVQTNVSNPTGGQQVVANSTSGSITFTLGGSLTVGEATVSAVHTDGTTTLSGLRTKLSDAGVSAQLINTGTGSTPWNLVLNASDTGTNHQLMVNTGTLGALSGGFSTLRAAADAQLTMGSLTITRHTNTVTDLIAGVTLELKKADPTKDVTVTVGRDTEAVVDKVKAFVDQLNSALTLMNTKSAPGDPDKKVAKGVLAGDSGLRRLEDLFANALWYMDPAAGAYPTASSVGLTRNTDGTYTLDETKLADALAADFDSVVDLLTEDTTAGTEGVFGSVLEVIDDARAADGLIASATQSAQASVDDIDDRIDSFEVRLDSIELRYRRQFAALEALMGQLQNQSAWLAGQVGSLD